MAYDDTSFYGDIVFDEYDDKGNFINPMTSAGFYVYHILGDGFDSMSDMCSKFLNDFSILSCDASSLDKYWGASYNMPRPKINVGTANERYLNDEEYRVYLYLRNCRLLTREDLEINMNKVFGFDDYTIFFSEETNYLNTTNHLVYTPTSTATSNISKNNDDDSDDYIIKQGVTDNDVHTIEGNLSIIDEVMNVINIPYNEWDTQFLQFLQEYISIKGNIVLKEYEL